MDYQSLISDIKDDIDNYSFDDSEYQKIYDRAFNDLQTGYDEQRRALAHGYYNERRRATGDNALNPRNAAEQLAEKGLARSGESADLLIGQNIALTNRLSELAEGHTAARAELLGNYSKQKAELGKEMAQQMTDAAAADKENLYDRLAHLEILNANAEKLEAEKEQWQAELDAEKDKWQSQLDFDRYSFDARLEADAAQNAWDQVRWQEELAAEEEKWRNQLAAEQYIQQQKINADKEKWQAQLANDRYEFNTNLKVEGQEVPEEKSGSFWVWLSDAVKSIFIGRKDEDNGGLDPDVSVQSMASNLVNRYDSKTGRLSEHSQDLVYSDFARLIATSNLDTDYATQVLAALRSKGFSKEFDIRLAQNSYVKEGYTIYNKTFDDFYEGMLSDGTPEDEALMTATEKAEEAVEEHINAQELDKTTKRQVLRMYGIT